MSNKKVLCIKNSRVTYTKNMKLLIKLKIFLLVCICVLSSCCFYGCSTQKIKLYDINTNQIKTLSLEDYVAGVTAAEIDTSFSTQAIAAQSVIARTFALWFKNNNLCKYEGADISNDITEAQAYTSDIPESIKKICNTTKGEVLKYNNKLFLPYYCSNCGGYSSLAQDVFNGNTSSYTSAVETKETAENSKNYSWQATVEKSTILHAMQKLNKSLASVNSFTIGKTDSSNRALTFIVGGTEVNANDFRLAIGSTIFKSCKLTNIEISANSITFSGLGYGHGVGLSQWGANIMGASNISYNNILLYYYKNCQIEKI